MSTLGRRRAGLLLIGALLAMFVVALGAGADHRVVISAPGAGERIWQAPEREAPAMDSERWEHQNIDTTEREQKPIVGTIIMGVLMTAAITLIVLVAVLVIRRLQPIRPEPRSRPTGAAEEPEALQVHEAKDAVAAAYEQLRTAADPHDGVIRAWLTLEQAIAQSGPRRAPSQTTREYVSSVLGAFALETAHIDRLAELYRRALFDNHPLEDADREEAGRLLGQLLEQLSASSTRTADRGPRASGGADTAGAGSGQVAHDP